MKRRCLTCDDGRTVAGNDKPHNTYCGLSSTWWNHDACCCFWIASAEEGSET